MVHKPSAGMIFAGWYDRKRLNQNLLLTNGHKAFYLWSNEETRG